MEDLIYHGVKSHRPYFVTGSNFLKTYKSIDVGPHEGVFTFIIDLRLRVAYFIFPPFIRLYETIIWKNSQLFVD